MIIIKINTFIIAHPKCWKDNKCFKNYPKKYKECI